MSVKLLTEQHSEFLNLKGGCTGSSESTLVKTPYCWKSHVVAKILKTMILLVLHKDLKLYPSNMNYVTQRTGDTISMV